MNLEQSSFYEWNSQGWFPGPEENKEEFEQRVYALSHFFPPEGIDHFLTEEDWKKAKQKTQILYDFSPDWIIAYYSSQGLSFFQGAVTWHFEEDGISFPLIQLRKKLEQGSLFSLYSKEEILAHEAVHATRMKFDEPFFEEIFAYRTSPRWFLRFFGPLFERPWESYLFLFLLFFPIAAAILPFFGIESSFFPLISALPYILLAVFALRLIFLQSVLQLALHKIQKQIKDKTKALAFALRLRDREIFQIAFLKTYRWQSYLQKQTSFRWKWLKQLYLDLA